MFILYGENGRVYVNPKITTDLSAEIRVYMTTPTGEKIVLTPNAENEIASPMLWWPNRLGEQNLYTVDVEIIEEGEVTDSRLA